MCILLCWSTELGTATYTSIYGPHAAWVNSPMHGDLTFPQTASPSSMYRKWSAVKPSRNITASGRIVLLKKSVLSQRPNPASVKGTWIQIILSKRHRSSCSWAVIAFSGHWWETGNNVCPRYNGKSESGQQQVKINNSHSRFGGSWEFRLWRGYTSIATLYNVQWWWVPFWLNMEHSSITKYRYEILEEERWIVYGKL